MMDELASGHSPADLHVNGVLRPVRRKRKRKPATVAKKKPGMNHAQLRDAFGRFAASAGAARHATGNVYDASDKEARDRAIAREASHRAARKRLAHRVAMFGGLAAASEALSNSRLSRHGKIDDSRGTMELRFGFGERNRGLRTYFREPNYHQRTYGRTPIVNGKRWKVEMDNRDGVSRAVYLITPNYAKEAWQRFTKEDEQAARKPRKSKRFPHGRSIKSAKVYEALRRAGYDKSAAAAISNAQRNNQRIGKVLADIQDGVIVVADRRQVIGEIASRRLDAAAAVTGGRFDERVAKHPGHSDQSIHAIRHGEDRGRRTVGKKPANRGRRNRQGHDPMGRYTRRSQKRDRRRALMLLGAIAAAGGAGGAGMKYHEQGVQLYHARRDVKRLRDAANRQRSRI